jgi:membrane protein
LANFRLRDLWLLFKDSFVAWVTSDVFRLSGALSFFTIFSLAPLLIIVLFVVESVWGAQSINAQNRILAEIAELTGPDGREMVRIMLESSQRPGSGGLIATLLGIGALLFGATGVFVQLKGALNSIWDIERRGGGLGIKRYFFSRLLSFGLILVVGFLLLVSLIVSAAITALDEFVVGLSPQLHFLMRGINIVVDLGVVTTLFAMIYKFLPDADIAWRDVWVGALITAVLFDIGKFLISLYLGNSSVTSAYGAAGALAVLLLWVYYSAMIVLFGAELTQTYVRRYGRRKTFVALDNPPASV